ncbi:MAG: lytic transglycosylase domain-containing protein, partial [Blastocatellia bacterium]
MRASFTLSGVILLSLFTTTALAQDGGARIISESTDAGGVPTMTVQEAVIKPPQQVTPKTVVAAKTAAGAKTGVATKPVDSSAKTGKSEVSVPASAADKQAYYASKPIVFSGASGNSVALTDTTGNLDYDRMVLDSAGRNGVDPDLIVAVMRQESGFNARAHSYKGACGLMQLMPATARRFGVANIADPAQNIEGGARYLRFLLDKFNDDVSLVLAGYNAGEGAVVDAG